MGGGHYSADVAKQARSTTRETFTYRGHASDSAAASARKTVHPILNVYGKKRECMNETAIVVALDVTRSRGEDTRIIYEKLPMLMGQLDLKGYVKKAAISFAAIGDATVDEAPLQVGQFEADNRLDEALSKFWIEEGGGGTGQESYELAAYYYARHSVIACFERCKKGYFFFIGDEAFYPQVDKAQVKRVCGFDINESIGADQIFRELQERYHVFLIYPKKSWQDHKADIDAEIQQRVEAAGGQYKDVDIRASLIWNNRNDLDLHVITPRKEEIYYANKRASCGGWLDVDMNVMGDSIKPVENIRWKAGEAHKGHYKVIVQNFRFHEGNQKPTEYRVEVAVDGEIKHFEGLISPSGETGQASNVPIYEFDYDPQQKKRTQEVDSNLYSGYQDENIKKQWLSVLPAEHILSIDDPKAIVDVILGVLALVEGGKDLDGYLNDMKDRKQAHARMEQTARALEGISGLHIPVADVQLKQTQKKDSGKDRSGGTIRLN